MRENQNGNKKQTLPKTSFNYLHSIIFISQAKNRLQNPRAYVGDGNAACGMHPTTIAKHIYRKTKQKTGEEKQGSVVTNRKQYDKQHVGVWVDVSQKVDVVENCNLNKY